MHFTLSRPQKTRKAQPGGGGLLTCLRYRRFHRPSWSKFILKKLGFGLGPDLTIIGSLNLNMMLKIEFSQINVAYGLTKDIKGYHIHIWSSSNSLAP
jgi:hypothetical protein